MNSIKKKKLWNLDCIIIFNDENNFATWHRAISPSIHSRPWFHQLFDLSRTIIIFFLVFVLLTIFFHFTNFVFPLIHHRFVLNTCLKPIVTIITFFLTVHFSHTSGLFFSQLSKYGYSSSNFKLLLNSRSLSVFFLITNFVINVGFLILFFIFLMF